MTEMAAARTITKVETERMTLNSVESYSEIGEEFEDKTSFYNPFIVGVRDSVHVQSDSEKCWCSQRHAIPTKSSIV